MHRQKYAIFSELLFGDPVKAIKQAERSKELNIPKDIIEIAENILKKYPSSDILTNEILNDLLGAYELLQTKDATIMIEALHWSLNMRDTS